MQYILGQNSVVVLSMPEHRSESITLGERPYKHFQHNDRMVIFRSPFPCIDEAIKTCLVENKKVKDVMRQLETILEIEKVDIHLIVTMDRWYRTGAVQVTNTSTWENHAYIDHYKVDDNRKLKQYRFESDQFYAYDLTYDVPEHTETYLGYRTHYAIRDLPDDTKDRYEEERRVAIDIIKDNCKYGMLHENFSEIVYNPEVGRIPEIIALAFNEQPANATEVYRGLGN